ncbi:class I SAM-dependent methyltransferase [Sphingomonas sp. DT-207]|uniref:class I SAM-dependent methyltransferase n=1 Tax=Sphingomonas sp. DT-207 TaxID=3396167 RepID=UPI003F1CCBB9
MAHGHDLSLLRDVHPAATLIAVETNGECCAILKSRVDEMHQLDIERDALPFSPGSVDLILANQVLEHTKEVFWIFDQISRSLKVGGHVIFGVPNVLSLHNRFLAFAGVHPTQHQLASAHIRPFSKADTVKFMRSCSGEIYKLAAFGGSQLYPLPVSLGRPICDLLPSWGFSIFFCFEKVSEYDGAFLRWPIEQHLETNFHLGANAGGSVANSAS